MSQPRVVRGQSGAVVAQCNLVEGAMHSGKKPQCILVKSDEFENSYSLLYCFLNPVYVAARSLRSLRSKYTTFAVCFQIYCSTAETGRKTESCGNSLKLDLHGKANQMGALAARRDL